MKPGPGSVGAEPSARVRIDPRTWRSQGVRIFSSASDAPRARRPTDIALFVLAILGIVAVTFPAPGPTGADSAIAALLAQVPSLLGWFWEISYDLLLGWSLLLMLLALFAHRRKRLFLDMALAAVLSLGFALLTGGIAGTDLTSSLKGIAASASPAVYLAVRLAIATAVVVTASPHMSRPMRYVGRWVLLGGAIASIALGVTFAVGMVAGFIVGVGSAALVHLLVGSPGGRLSQEQVGGALRELGVEVAEIHPAPLEPRGVAISLATTTAGRPLLVKTFGRDAWDGQLLASTWSSIWHRGETPRLGAGRLQQVEHEAFVTLLAQRAGVPVMPVVAAGMAAEGDALLVTEADARPLAALSSEEIDDGLLLGLWTSLEALHDLRIAHGRIDGIRVVVRPDGSPALADLGSAKMAADGGTLCTDRAQLLVSTALAVGSDRAVDAAVRAMGQDGLTAVLPYLQPAVLDVATRRAVKEQEWDLKALRTLAAERTGSEVPALEQLRRVSFGSIAKLALIGLVVYMLFSALANIGLQDLIDEFKNASMGWLVAALVLTPFVQVPQAFSTLGATMKAIKFLPVLMLQYGVQFIALAVPSSAARIALEIRFFERVGVPGAGAVSIGMIDSFSTFIIQMVMIVVITLSGLASLNLTASTSSSSGSGPSIDWWWVLVALGLLVVAGIVVYFVPKFRAMLTRFRVGLREKAADGREALQVLRHPSKLLLLFVGNFVAQVMLAVVLGLCLRAFGAKATLAQLILINTFVSLFAGFMPVPGGVGVAEAGYTAGLIAIGIPSAVASSTAIAFRMVTFYLPPLWGGFAMSWMKRHSYL